MNGDDPVIRAALSWAADQIQDEMRHWPDGPSKVAMAKVQNRILHPHSFIRHQLDNALKAAVP
jgi:hypothetical protein